MYRAADMGGLFAVVGHVEAQPPLPLRVVPALRKQTSADFLIMSEIPLHAHVGHLGVGPTMHRFRRRRLDTWCGNTKEGKCKATWKREFKLPWCEASAPHHHDEKVDSDQ